MKTDMKYAVAVLVDGDNASFENLEDVMGFVSRHGNAIIRRIYGDWTRKPLSGWKDAAGEHGFRLVQASSFASGKNTTDIALVIDAMDILRDGLADCFCLVASDGDYTLLAQRIREAGLPVLGYGEGKTRHRWYAPVLNFCMRTAWKGSRWRIRPDTFSGGIWNILTGLSRRPPTVRRKFLSR